MELARKLSRPCLAEGITVAEDAGPAGDELGGARAGMVRHLIRRTVPRTAGFWILASLFLALFFASSASSPLYRVYQASFHFSASILTFIFAVYVLVLLVTLLFFGRISDYLGRLPVIIAALVISAGACATFLSAHSVGALIAARSLQGVATGLANAPIGAALIDLQPPGSQRGPLVSSAFSSLGLALGALVTSVLVQYAPAPTHLVWWVLLAVFIIGIVPVLAMTEPGTRRPGALASLQPRISIPPQARGAFAAAAPCIVGPWALGGLYLSLGPSLAAEAAGSANVIWGGLVIFLLCGTGSAAALALRNLSTRRTMLTGCIFLVAGMGITCGAIAAGTSALLLSGTTVAGVGFGLAFLGAFRMVTALAAPDQRAGLVSAIFIVVYLSFSVPALIAGAATADFGLRSTGLVYSAVLAVLAAGALCLLLIRRRAPATPLQSPLAQVVPVPCATPPCPQALAEPGLATPGASADGQSPRGGAVIS